MTKPVFLPGSKPESIDPQELTKALTTYRRFVKSDPPANKQTFDQQETLIDKITPADLAEPIIAREPIQTTATPEDFEQFQEHLQAGLDDKYAFLAHRPGTIYAVQRDKRLVDLFTGEQHRGPAEQNIMGVIYQGLPETATPLRLYEEDHFTTKFVDVFARPHKFTTNSWQAKRSTVGNRPDEKTFAKAFIYCGTDKTEPDNYLMDFNGKPCLYPNGHEASDLIRKFMHPKECRRVFEGHKHRPKLIGSFAYKGVEALVHADGSITHDGFQPGYNYYRLDAAADRTEETNTIPVDPDYT